MNSLKQNITEIKSCLKFTVKHTTRCRPLSGENSSLTKLERLLTLGLVPPINNGSDNRNSAWDFFAVPGSEMRDSASLRTFPVIFQSWS